MGPLETLDMTGIDLEYNVYMEKIQNLWRQSRSSCGVFDREICKR